MNVEARDMLNRAVGGAYGFSTDIGGYPVAPAPSTTATTTSSVGGGTASPATPVPVQPRFAG